MPTIEPFTENIKAFFPKDFAIDVAFNTISFGLCKTIYLFTKRLKMTTFDWFCSRLARPRCMAGAT